MFSHIRTAAAVVALGCALTLGLADRAARAATLSAQDVADVKRVEDYFNQIGTLQARFIQLSPNGRFAQGSLYLWRPDKLRFEYDPPIPYLLIAEGGRVIFYDKELETPAFVSVSDTPLEFLLASSVSLSQDVTVTQVERGPGTLRITLVQTSKPEDGAVQITFSERPFEVKKWSLIDSRGTAVHIAILDPRFGVDLDPTLFEFKNPTFQREPRTESDDK